MPYSICGASSTVVAITGKTATPAGKQASVKVSFKAKKTGKTSKYSYVSKVSVIEDKLTMTAKATGVKTIVAEFNKAIADASKVKVTVKKGTATRDCTATVDGSKITLAMAANLTAGTYTVSVEGVADTAMEANVIVEKDETLTSFEISDYFVAESTTVTTNGTIKYAALNQYGEKMTSNQPTATCSFGSDIKVTPATATKEGEISVKGIAPTLAIVGTKGTVVLVDDKGVTASKEISYNVAATASTVELVGTYHKNSASLKNITENDTVSDYELLFTVKDQYGYDIEASKLSTLQISLVSGLTNLNAGNATTLSTRTYKGVDYVALPLTGTAKAMAGDATLMIVNPYKGLLLNTTVTVAKSIVIKSIAITADNGVYADQDNEMGYEIVDADGKSVTSYADLTNSVDLKGSKSSNYTMRFERKSDGTAKLLLKPKKDVVVTSDTASNKNSTPMVVIVSANKMTSSDYLMKTFTFTVNEKRVVTGVTGIKSDVVTSMSKADTKGLTIKSTDLLLADQYSNKVTSDEGIFNKNLYNVKVPENVSGTAIAVDTNKCVSVNIDTTKNEMKVTPTTEVGTATVYLKYGDGSKAVVASSSDFDAKFSISVYDTASVDVSTLAIDSINDGFSVKLKKDTATGSANIAKALAKDDVKVVAMVGGTKTVIPASQYVIVKNENNSLSASEVNAGTDTKTAKLTVQVTTWDSSNTPIETEISKEYQVSMAPSKLYKVTDAKDLTNTIEAATTVTGAAFVKQFTFVNQYSEPVKENDGTKTDSVSYKIENISATNKSGYTISYNNTNQAQVQIKEAGEYTFKVTVTAPNGSTKAFNYTVNW